MPNNLAPLPPRNQLEAGDTLPDLFTLSTKDNFDAINSTAAGSGASMIGIDTSTLSSSGDSVQQYLEYLENKFGTIVITMQSAFDNGNNIVIADNDNKTFSIVNNDVTNNPQTLTISSLTTTVDVVEISSDTVTTGGLLRAYSNSGSTAARNLVEIINNNVSANTAKCLLVQQLSTNSAVNITGASTVGVINLTSSAAAGEGIRFNHTGTGIEFKPQAVLSKMITSTDSTTTTVDSVSIVGDAKTTGGLAVFSSNSASVSARNLFVIKNDNTAATAAKCLVIQQDSVADAVNILNAGAGIVFTDTSTTKNSIEITATNKTTGGLAEFVCASSSTSTRNIIGVFNTDAAASGTTCIKVTQAANQTSLNIDSEATSQPAAIIDIPAGDAHLRLVGDSGNATPTEGDLWRESDGLKYYDGTTEHNITDSLTQEVLLLTRTLNATAGDVVYTHNLGKLPKLIIFTAYFDNSDYLSQSNGSYDGTNNKCTYISNNSGVLTASNDATKAIYLYGVTAYVSATTTGNFTLTWSSGSAGTGYITATIIS